MSRTSPSTVPNTTPAWSPATTAKVILGTAFGAALLLVAATFAFSPGRTPRAMENAFRQSRSLATVVKSDEALPPGTIAEIMLGESNYPVRPVGPFSLVDQTGEPFELADLAGKWWVAGFIFSNCGTTCPPMAGAMQHLQQELIGTPDNIRFVFFSVDSDNDTPEVLAKFGERYGANPDRWKLLTGEGKREEIWKLAKDSFFAGVMHGEGEAVEPILHSRKFFLVNPLGKIVAHYDGLEAAEVADLLERLRAIDSPTGE